MKASEYKEQIEKMGVFAFVPRGTSMWPTLKSGRQSIILLPKKERLKVYDIAFYERENDTPVLHRIVEVTPEGYVFCGDSLKEREFVSEKDVFAVMVGYYKGKKYISAQSEEFYEKSRKLYENEKKRIKRAERYFKYLTFKDTLTDLFRLRRKNK